MLLQLPTEDSDLEVGQGGWHAMDVSGSHLEPWSKPPMELSPSVVASQTARREHLAIRTFSSLFV